MKPLFCLALITGASSGIGRSLCQLLAEKGINLILVSRNEEELNDLKEQLAQKVKVSVFPADLSLLESRQKLVKLIQDEAPDLVVNNAGLGLYGEALSHSTQEQMNILEVNVNALLELTLEACRALIAKGKKGVIMNVASAAAFFTFPNFAVYAASKAFVKEVSCSLDEEVKTYGVRVLVSCPGRVITNFQVRAGGHQLSSKEAMDVDFAAQEIWKQICQKKPLHIFDWKYRLGVFLCQFIPRQWVIRRLKEEIKKNS